jgi:hypothetical protein
VNRAKLVGFADFSLSWCDYDKKTGASDGRNKCCEDETWQSNCEHSDRSSQKEGDGSP